MGADTEATKTLTVPAMLHPTITMGAQRTRKVAIVGYTYSQREAPWDDPEWEVWGLNDLHRFIQGATWHAWFDLHDEKTLRSNEEHVAWLRQPHPFPIYVWEPRSEWPATVRFPRDELIAEYGNYWTNSISWMIGLALKQVAWAKGQGAEIGVYGVDMAQDTEYAQQRPSCEYIIGLARGLGIPVTVPDSSDLLKTVAVYGSRESDAFNAKLSSKEEEIRSRMAEVQGEIGKLNTALRDLQLGHAQLEGALELARSLKATWGSATVSAENRFSDGQRAQGAGEVLKVKELS